MKVTHNSHNRASMINQNITFHLSKYNSNMFSVLKVITDKLTLLCLGRETN